MKSKKGLLKVLIILSAMAMLLCGATMSVSAASKTYKVTFVNKATGKSKVKTVTKGKSVTYTAASVKAHAVSSAKSSTKKNGGVTATGSGNRKITVKNVTGNQTITIKYKQTAPIVRIKNSITGKYSYKYPKLNGTCSLTTPSMTGYKFVHYTGWSKTKKFTAAKTYDVTAVFQPIQYTIVYKSGYGSGSGLHDQIVKYNENVILQYNNGAFVKSGYNFAGWKITNATNSKNNGTYQGGANLGSGLTTKDGAKIYATAQWTKMTATQVAEVKKTDAQQEKTVTVTINLDGGAFDPIDIKDNKYETRTSFTYKYKDGGKETIPAPYKAGYSFSGWTVKYGNTTTTTTRYQVGNGNNSDQVLTHANISENVTLTARWSANTYKIVYDYAGGSADKNMRKNPDGCIQNHGVYDVYAPVRSGYVFTGWKVSNASTGKVLKEGITQNPYSFKGSQNLRFTATWK